MIERAEIDRRAAELAVLPVNVERDYIFGWILAGIFTKSALAESLFLKGGNALRKAYFDETRFSGDLDFGLSGDIAETVLLEEINRVCVWIAEATGVPFPTEQNQIKEKFVATDGPSATPNLKVYEVRVYFNDFYGKQTSMRIRISMDVTRFDRTILPLQRRQLIHPYSDADQVRCEITCMKLQEIIATKLKCLIQREHAPDLFDYVYAVRQLGAELDRGEVVRTFVQKTIFDRNPFLLKNILREASPLEFIRATWHATVVCASHVAIGVEEAIAAFLTDLDDLFAGYVDNGYARFEYFPAAQRAIIMKAGRTQTLLKARYKGAERLLEPYSLKYMQKRGGEEKEYFYVFNRSSGDSAPGMRSLIPDNLEAIENTGEKFEPQYPIELSKAGELPEDRYLFDPNRPSKAPKSRFGQTMASPRSGPRSSLGLAGPRYVFKCAVCGKRFTRSTYDASMNPHKGKNGFHCYGSYGVYVETKY